MKRISAWLHRLVSALIRWILQFLVLLAFRPKMLFASEKARQDAFSVPSVIICNHIRGMDAAMLYVLLHRRKFKAITAKDLQDEDPFLRFFMRFMPVITVDRQHPTLSWLRESRRTLKNGEHIMLFPEGYCNRKKVIQPFKSGSVMLAASAGVPIVPMYLDGEYHPFIGRRCRMMVGEPITVTPPPEGLEAQELTRQDRALRHEMRRLELQLNGSVRVDYVPEDDMPKSISETTSGALKG